MSPRVKDLQEPSQHISSKEIKKAASEKGRGSRPRGHTRVVSPCAPGLGVQGPHGSRARASSEPREN